MVAKFIRLTHKIVIQLHLVVESCTIWNSHFTQPVQKLLDTPLYVVSNSDIICAVIFIIILFKIGTINTFLSLLWQFFLIPN